MVVVQWRIIIVITTTFAEVDFQNVPKKFRENCEQHHSFWYNRVKEGILYIAGSSDDSEMLQLHRGTIDIKGDVVIREKRRLERLAEIEDRDVQSVQPYRRPLRHFFRGSDDRELVEDEMDRDLKNVQPYCRSIRRFFRRYFRRGGDDRELVAENEMDRNLIVDRDLQSVQPYRRPIHRFFRQFFRRGGDDHELAAEDEVDRELIVDEEMDRELKWMKPCKKKNKWKRGDDRD